MATSGPRLNATINKIYISDVTRCCAVAYAIRHQLQRQQARRIAQALDKTRVSSMVCIGDGLQGGSFN